MSVNFEYYRIFYYVARYLSMTQAAHALGNNQPNVTRCINTLEHELGCRLFTRSNRGVTLTGEGERLYLHIAEACRRLETAEEELSGSRKLEIGSVSVAATETALHLLLLERLRIFHDRYPGVHICISYQTTLQAISALRAGQVDFAVVATPAVAEAPLREIPLLEFREILIGGARYETLSREKQTLKSVSSYPLICMAQGTMTFRFYEQLFAEAGLALRPDTEAANIDQVLQLARSGLGLGFLPCAVARESLARGEVVQIPLVEEIPPRQVCMVKNTARPLSIAARALERELLRPFSNPLGQKKY